jgi:acetoin utilization deacetylase AcuC-like enzyme
LSWNRKSSTIAAVIIYTERTGSGLQQYGITIPVHDQRASRTFEMLLTDPELAARQGQWHLRHTGEKISREDLLRAHSPEFVERLFSDGLEEEVVRAYELRDSAGRYNRFDPSRASKPLEQILDRSLYNTSGTYQSCRLALKSGFGFYFGGGAHHAHRDYGKGFCLTNDVVVALRRIQAEGLTRNAWVVDVDAHKGDGTAALTAGDDSIRTLSVHMAAGWPLDEPQVDAEGRPNPSFVPSDIDIPVAEGEEDHYVRRLAAGLEELARLPLADYPGRQARGLAAGARQSPGRPRVPDLALVVSGSDPYEYDELASASLLRLSLPQMLERDQLIYRFLSERRIPAAYVMSGGYGERSWEVYYHFLRWVLRLRLGLPPVAPN